MRSRLAPSVRLALAAILLLGPVAAEPASAPEGPSAATTEAARARFKTGVRLYQDQNYAGALAEFEAAYELKPGPGSLQNMALCQKALLRYAEAVSSLERLLTEHAAELSAAERSAAERAKVELEALVGRVRVELSPPSATVTLDGTPFTERQASVRVSAGEHTFAAWAPGYSRVTRTFSVASGQSDLVVSLALEPVSGFLAISSPDPEAAIAIDGKPVAYGQTLAPVSPDQEHLVQIYRPGAQPFETRVKVALGETVTVTGGASPAAIVAAPPGDAAPAGAGQKPRVGWYGVGALSLLATGAAPFRFEQSDARSGAWAIGLRAGRRIHPVVAVEGLLEYSALKVSDACDAYRGELAAPRITCDSPEASALNVSYDVRSVRFGPALTLMTTGPRLRALGGLGLGLVWHELRCDGCIPGREQKGSGTDGFFLLELGAGANTGHALFALTLQAIIDGTAGMISGRNLGTEAEPVRETAYARSGRALAYVGLNLRVGYSEWAP